jgi:ABC-type multidrug transport system fused ATPase/permease subunit
MIKRTGKFFQNLLLYLFLACSIFAVFVTLFSNKSADGTAEIFGYQMRLVTSNSMAACDHTDVSGYSIKDIPIRSLIFVRMIPEDPDDAYEWYQNLQVGDVLTFRYVYTNQVTITHRITSITEKETRGFLIELAGDNKNAESDQLYQTIDTSIPNNTNYVIGKVTGQAYLLGLLISLMTTKFGLVLFIILPCLFIILAEGCKMVQILTADKKRLLQEENERRENELRQLRQKLLELENARQAEQSGNKYTEESRIE